jgi:hypothetical protein
MKESKLKNQLLFQKTNIARLTQNNLHVIIGGANNDSEGRPDPRTDTIISFTVITSSWKCIDLFGVTTSS